MDPVYVCSVGADYITFFIQNSPIKKQGRSVDPLLGRRKGKTRPPTVREESPFEALHFRCDVSVPFSIFPFKL